MGCSCVGGAGVSGAKDTALMTRTIIPIIRYVCVPMKPAHIYKGSLCDFQGHIVHFPPLNFNAAIESRNGLTLH